MPISPEQKEYPLCDTDLWIGVSQLNEMDVIFTQYNIIFICDAVKKELINKREDDPSKFECGYLNYRKFKDNGKVKFMQLANDAQFNEKEKSLVISHFLNLGIKYNQENDEFIGRTKNLGEKVSLIYAGIHSMPVVLSNDGGANKFASAHFKHVQVINLRELLIRYGYSNTECSRVLNQYTTNGSNAPKGLSSYKKKFVS